MNARGIERAPAYSGQARAWEMKMGDHATADQSATVAAYVINGPYHPFWSWWMVAVVHLRPIEGVTKPAAKHYPEAEYEFMIISINPEGNAPDPDKPFPQDVSYLTPPDCVVQFDGVNDDQAAEICDAAARTIANGMSCDSDFREWWTNAIKNTVEHYRQGIH